MRLDPSQGGELRAVGDIGSHSLDLTSFIAGQPIVAVMAELATFVPVRQQPLGPVETFSTERSSDTVPREMRSDDAALIMLRCANGARGVVAISQVSAGRKNSLVYEIDGSRASAAWDAETPDHLWVGHRDRANELLLRNPALMGSEGADELPAGWTRARIRGYVPGALPCRIFGHRRGRTCQRAHLGVLRGRSPCDAAGRRDRNQRPGRALGPPLVQ